MIYFKYEKVGGNMKKEKSCGAVIFRKIQNRYEYVLIQQKYSLNFGFPKGHVEHNENELMTAYREVKEETGLDIEIFEKIREQTRYSPRPGTIKDVIYFLAKAKSHYIQKQEEEIVDAMWVEESEVFNKLTYQSDKRMFKSILNHFKVGK